jgi:hypothetical protein
MGSLVIVTVACALRETARQHAAAASRAAADHAPIKQWDAATAGIDRVDIGPARRSSCAIPRLSCVEPRCRFSEILDRHRKSQPSPAP